MKPFNLEAAKAGAPLVTRAGREVLHFHHVETDTTRLCCVVHIAGRQGATWIPKTGRYDDEEEHGDDLFMATKKRTVYVQVFGVDADTIAASPAFRAVAFKNEEAANRNIDTTEGPVLGTFPVEIEE